MSRSTRQREAIRAALADAGRPLSPREIHARAAAHCERLGLATVYRTIRMLLDDAEITTVELPGDSARYELAGKHHHHHFRCRICEGVFELDGCPPLEITLPPGFTADDHEIILYGRCAECGD